MSNRLEYERSIRIDIHGQIIQLRRDPKGEEKRIRATLRKPSPSVSLENDRFQQQVKVTTEENRRLRGFLEQVGCHG